MANDTTKNETKAEPEKPAKKTEGEVKKNNTNGKTIAIAILSAVIGCIIIVLAVLLCTGVIEFNDPDDGTDDPYGSSHHDRRDDGDDGKRQKRTDSDDKDDLIDNPYPEVTAEGTVAEVDDLKFYLPSEFEFGGKNKQGAYTYNLTDDDGWAQVLVYAERTSLSPEAYLNKISDHSLDITDDDYEINGAE